MEITAVSETGAANYFYHYLHGEFKRMAGEIAEAHPEVDWTMNIVFFCMPKNHTRKTSCRLLDQGKRLEIRIAFVEDAFTGALMAEQRFIFGHTVFNYLSGCIGKKFKKSKILDSLVDSFRIQMKQRGWLEDEVDYANALDEGYYFHEGSAR